MRSPPETARSDTGTTPVVAAAADAAALLKANRRGILFMCAAMALFVVNDSLVKYASQTMPSTQLIFLRGVMASVIALALVRSARALPRIGEIRHGWVAVRSWMDAAGTIIYLVALFHLPIANATAITMTSPLFIVVFAAMVMRERVGLGRWLAVIIGFLGVVLIIQPSAAGFNAWSVVCLVGTLLMAARDLLTRRIAADVPASVITLATAVAVTILSGVLSLIQGWQPFSGFELMLLAFAACFLAGGYYCIVVGMRHGEISVIGPFRYSGLLWALLIGFIVWGDIPNALAWAGIALLTGSGLYVVYSGRAARARV